MQIVKEGEISDGTVSSICRKYGISNLTHYLWRRKYNGFKIPEAKRIKQLEEENSKLKKLLAEREVEVNALKEILRKNFQMEIGMR
jgi:putative transposase